MSDEKPMGQVIQIDEARIRDHLGELVRGTVEETLNAMLDAEADQLCGAGRYERSQARQDTRAGSYERTLQTSAGEVNLKVPKLRRQTFETAIIDRYRRRESSVEEALIEMYLAGISVRRVEDITEALWGTRVSPSTVSNLNKKIYAKIEAWRNRRIEGEHPYLYLDGIVMKRTWAGEVRNVSLLVASAVNSEGFREILGICEGAKEDKSGWSAFLRHLVDRGLNGVQLIISDACRGLMESAAEYLPDARWQRCMVHFYRNIFSHVPATKVREVSHMLKAIHSQENRNAADRKARAIVEALRAGRMNTAADLVERGVHETLTCRVGGGALDCSRADLRPPHKLDVQFSRIQLSRRRYPLSGDGRDQRDKINKPELAVELTEWQRCPATAAPLAEPMRPNSPHQPAIELVEELSDVSPLVVVAPTTHDGVDLFYQLLSAHRSVPPREPAYLIPEVTDRFLPGKRI